MGEKEKSKVLYGNCPNLIDLKNLHTTLFDIISMEYYYHSVSYINSYLDLFSLPKLLKVGGELSISKKCKPIYIGRYEGLWKPL